MTRNLGSHQATPDQAVLSMLAADDNFSGINEAQQCQAAVLPMKCWGDLHLQVEESAQSPVE